MSREYIIEKLKNILIGIGIYDENPKYQKKLLEEMDSLLFIQLIIEIESGFEIGIPDDKLLLEYFNSYESIVEVIFSQLDKNN